MRSAILCIAALFLSPVLSYSQQIGCVDKSMRVQAEQTKHAFKVQGMEVYKDAMLTMEPKTPYPIAVQLQQNEVYQFVFIGVAGADLQLELYDGTDKKLSEKTLRGKEGNYMIYSFKPERPDLYLVVLTQKMKGRKEACASFTIMKKSADNNNR